MADSNGTGSGFSVEKFERVDDLLQRLKGEAREAHQAGDMFMLSVYNDMLQVCSPIVVKAKARLEREENAVLNKREKELRKAEREARNAKRANA